MRKLVLLLSLAVAMTAHLVVAAESDAVPKAQAAANAWLALADAGKYGATWDEAAAIFKSSISRADWEKALARVRSQLGAVKGRSVKSATFTTTLPGVPDGEYVVVQCDTRFESKAAAVETVTAMREKDGAWRVAGYFIR